jgi:hypothetical protein
MRGYLSRCLDFDFQELPAQCQPGAKNTGYLLVYPHFYF